MTFVFYALNPIYCKYPIFSDLIKFFQRKNYSHFASTWGDYNFVMDATSKGVKLTKDEDFFKWYEIKKMWVLELNIPQDIFDSWLNKQLGKKYAFIQNVSYVFKHFWLNLGKDEKRVNCSELQALLLQLGGIDIGDSDKYDLVELEILLNRLTKD